MSKYVKLGQYISPKPKSLISGPFGSNISSKFFTEVGVPVIRGNNLNSTNQKFIDDGFVFVSESKANELNCDAIAGDIVFTAAGTIGQVGIIEEKNRFNRYVISNKQIRLRLNEEICNRDFIYFVLNSDFIRQQIINNDTGSTIPLINLSVIRNLKIPKFELSCQNKIATILSAIYNKIELNNRINTELEAMAKLVYEYWFVQFDFPLGFDSAQPPGSTQGKPSAFDFAQGDNGLALSGVEGYKSSGGKMVWNEELKREIPEGWEVKCLHEIANIKMGQSPEGSTYNEEGKGLIFFQGSTDFGWRFPENRVYTTAPTRFASKGDILLSVRAPIGTMNIALVDCCIGRGLAALNSKDGFSSFLIYQMTFFKQKFDYLNSVGTTFGSLTKDDLYNLQLVYPPKEILKKFEDKVTSFDKKIENNTLENQQLSSLRDWLLPMLINGQVSVDEVEERVEEELGMVAEPEREEYKSHQS